jgi:antibiotic biosynthesis monooxygenase (ABM) superfamily enzyme
MRRILTFDAYASQDEVAEESAATLRRIPGVISAEILSAVGGQPRYCVIMETDDGQDAEVVARINASLQEYAGYVSNVTNRAFRRIG